MALAQRGARVALAARREERLAALGERLAETGEGEITVIPCDVRQPEDVQRLIATTLERWGKIDILVANAGFGYRSPIAEEISRSGRICSIRTSMACC